MGIRLVQPLDMLYTLQIHPGYTSNLLFLLMWFKKAGQVYLFFAPNLVVLSGLCFFIPAPFVFSFWAQKAAVVVKQFGFSLGCADDRLTPRHQARKASSLNNLQKPNRSYLNSSAFLRRKPGRGCAIASKGTRTPSN